MATPPANGVYRTQEEEMEHRFTYHPPREGQPEKYQTLRDAAKQLALLIVATTPVCREQSLALTSLEEAIFWANASIARKG